MKRSEMIAQINEYMNAPQPSADGLLQMIEAAGMLPPPLTNTPYPVNTVTPDQWEPEDETE